MGISHCAQAWRVWSGDVGERSQPVHRQHRRVGADFSRSRARLCLSPGGDTHGESDGDFYTTLRGRVGVTLDWQGCWLIYGTGGAIGVNYTTRVIDDCVTGACGPDLLDGRRTDFDWGYTVGGGIERMIGTHWSIKAEYLYYGLDDQSFTARDSGGSTLNWRAETEGHIVRAGLNYKF